jgi:homoserine O-acetyltransferase
MRRMIIEAIENDPDWKNGEYTTQPRGLADAVHVLLLMTSVPLLWQKEYPTRAAADSELDVRTERTLAQQDANDMIYQFEASREYNPAPHLGQITAPLYAINSADDQVNPPELGLMDREIGRVAKGKYILIPISNQTRGHGTHSLPAIWGKYLEELLQVSAKGQ